MTRNHAPVEHHGTLVVHRSCKIVHDCARRSAQRLTTGTQWVRAVPPAPTGSQILQSCTWPLPSSKRRSQVCHTVTYMPTLMHRLCSPAIVRNGAHGVCHCVMHAPCMSCAHSVPCLPCTLVHQGVHSEWCPSNAQSSDTIVQNSCANCMTYTYHTPAIHHSKNARWSLSQFCVGLVHHPFWAFACLPLMKVQLLQRRSERSSSGV